MATNRQLKISKYGSYCATIALQFYVIVNMKLFDELDNIMKFLLLTLVFGALFYLVDRENISISGKIGWGIFYGTLTSIILGVCFIVIMLLTLSSVKW